MNLLCMHAVIFDGFYIGLWWSVEIVSWNNGEVRLFTVILILVNRLDNIIFVESLDANSEPFVNVIVIVSLGPNVFCEIISIDRVII